MIPHHGIWIWVWVVLPQEEIADILGLYALCVAAFGVKSNVADSKTVTVRQPWGYELEQQEAIIFCGNLWNESNWFVRQCKKLDHNRDLEIIKPVPHMEVDWEVIIMRNSFCHLNIAKDIWEAGRVTKTAHIDNSCKCLGGSKRVSWGLPCLHIPYDLYSRNEGRWALGKRERCKRWRFPSRAVHSEQTVRASFSGSRVSRGGLRLLSPTEYLTIIPLARMGSESIAHEAEGYWLRAHSGKRNNCFSKIQLVGKKISRQNNFS